MSFSQQLNNVINSVFGFTNQNQNQNQQQMDDNVEELGQIMNNSSISNPPVLGEQDCYLVDELLDSRLLPNGETEYLVKWDNPDFEPSWEPSENINPTLIRNFLLNKEVKQHNINIKNKTGLPQNQLSSAHLYLRVSDPTKTSALFKKSTNTQNQNQTQQGQGQTDYHAQCNNTFTSYQAYFSAFPAGNFSLESQKEILLKYCVENNLLVSSIEMDDGVSARNPEKLRGLQTIVSCIKAKETLLVLDLSRFARNTLGGLQILENLAQRGVRIYSVLDGMNYDTPASRHCVRTTISCAQLESDIKSMKLKASIQNIRNKGGYIGSKAPFGFKIIREGTLRKLIKNTNEQKVIEMINKVGYKTPNMGKNNITQIAEKLNNMGLRNRGKCFTPSTIKYIYNKNKSNTVAVDEMNIDSDTDSNDNDNDIQPQQKKQITMDINMETKNRKTFMKSAYENVKNKKIKLNRQMVVN